VRFKTENSDNEQENCQERSRSNSGSHLAPHHHINSSVLGGNINKPRAVEEFMLSDLKKKVRKYCEVLSARMQQQQAINSTSTACAAQQQQTLPIA
jgi:hypothetical protein